MNSIPYTPYYQALSSNLPLFTFKNQGQFPPLLPIVFKKAHRILSILVKKFAALQTFLCSKTPKLHAFSFRYTFQKLLKMNPSTTTTALPKHVAIIMDGNGRWAELRGLHRLEGHRQGVNRVRDIVAAAMEQKIQYLTLYAFSTENWQRPTTEVQGLMHLLSHSLQTFLEELHQQGIKLSIIGQLDSLPAITRNIIQAALERTVSNTQFTLILALSYSTRSETLETIKRCLLAHQAGQLDINQLNWKQFSQFLDTKDIPDPDLVIRTSGEMRLSNFLLLQSAYAELIFDPTLWPDFSKEHFKKCLEDYQSRTRRFGKLNASTPEKDFFEISTHLF